MKRPAATPPAAPRIPWAFRLDDAPRLPLTGEDHPLRRGSERRLGWACGLALLAGLLAFAGWRLLDRGPHAAAAPREIRLVRYADLGAPPSITRPAAPQVRLARESDTAAETPPIGVPVPVADELAEAPTIATTDEMAAAMTQAAEGSFGAGDSLVVEPVDAAPSPAAATPATSPVRLSIEPLDYPPLARSAEVEGTVVVRVLVGVDGRVKDVVVDEGAPMLREAAIACARTSIWRPAQVGREPIEAWARMPLTFKLLR